MTGFDEYVDFYMNVGGLDRTEAEHCANVLMLRDQNAPTIDHWKGPPDPEEAWEIQKESFPRARPAAEALVEDQDEVVA